MKTIRVEYIKPVFVETINAKEMEQGVFYISEKYSQTNHLCLCGCGEQTPMPLSNYGDIKWENGWQMQISEDGKVSITPSIGNFQIACKSHYIITKNKANFV